MTDKPKRKNFTYPEDSFLGAKERLDAAIYELWDATGIEDTLTDAVMGLNNGIIKISKFLNNHKRFSNLLFYGLFSLVFLLLLFMQP